MEALDGMLTVDAELTPTRLARIVELARLASDGPELGALAAQLGDVLAHLEVLAGAPVDALPPAVRAPTGEGRAWRDDAPAASLPVAVALAAAPDALGDGFAVPAILAPPAVR